MKGSFCLVNGAAGLRLFTLLFANLLPMKFVFLIQRGSIDAKAASSSRVSSFSSLRLMRERSLSPSSVTQRGVDCLLAFAFGRSY